MQREDVHILIIDDDLTLGKALSEALTRSGLKAHHFSKPDEAQKFIKFNHVDLAVIDCMLPKINGRELAKQLRAEVLRDTQQDLPVLLMSGIYKDKTFIREALQSTGAVNFLTKPFELTAFKAEIEKIIEPKLAAPMSKLFKLLTTSESSPKEITRAVFESEPVHGFDLPWIFSLLLHPKISGHLNIISADGAVSGVGFLKGEIVQVFQEDQQSFFGALLVENGFITQPELDQIKNSLDPRKKIGERLVEENLISPHAVDLVLTQQQGIRLSKAINNTSVKVNFTEADDVRINARTDRTGFDLLINDWLASKITDDWLKSHYIPWMQFNLKKGAEWVDNHPILSIPALQSAKGIVNALLDGRSLESIVSSSKFPETTVLRALHALLLARVVRFGETVNQADFNATRKRLSNLNEKLDHQTYFERLGVSPQAKESEVKRAYHDLAKALHPDKLGPSAPADVRELSKLAFEKVSAAYAALSDPKARAQYLQELEKGTAEAQLEASTLTERARQLLATGEIKLARDLIEKAIALAPPTVETKLLHIWSRLKSPNAESDEAFKNAIKEEISAIPPEDRHSSHFLFIRAMFLRLTGDFEGARRNLNNVLDQAPDFIEARRELNLVANDEKTSVKPVNILSGDLKDVVGLLFKKKK